MSPSDPKPKNISDRVLVLEESVERMEGSLKEIKTLITDGAATQKGDRRHAWTTALSVAGIVGGVLAYVHNAAIDSKISPLIAASASSIKDREGLLRMTESNQSRIGVLENHLASITATYDARLTESETQIAAVENVQSVMHWHQEIINQILSQNKGVDYPIVPVPQANISNRRNPLPKAK